MDNVESVSSQPVSAYAVYRTQNLADRAERSLKRRRQKRNKTAQSQPPPQNNVQNNAQRNRRSDSENVIKKRRNSIVIIEKSSESSLLDDSESNAVVLDDDTNSSSSSTAQKKAANPMQQIQVVADVVDQPAEKLKVLKKETAATDPKEFRPITSHSVRVGKKIFNWLVGPMRSEHFLLTCWERAPYYLARNAPNYYNKIISTPMIDEMLRKERVLYSQHIDITSYLNGVKELHNPDGQALPHVVWDYYINGCSIRLLNPQLFLPSVHMILATLQEFTGSYVGANVYLTPPSTQGFAPHYDDIEAFILQVEGKKTWRVYKPLSEKNVLPRYSSEDFSQNDLGKPYMEVILKPGDLLYLPRGFIHQAVATTGHHSLHLTVSMFQKHSYADLLEKVLPVALNNAINDNVEFRKALPFDIHSNFGYTKKENVKPSRDSCIKMVKSLIKKVATYIDLDEGVDAMMKEFQGCALPPVLTTSEKEVTVFGNYSVMQKNGKIGRRAQLTLETRVRLLRKNIIRLMSEDGILKMYFYAGNSLLHPGSEMEPIYMEVEQCLETCITRLINDYPNYIKIGDLPAHNDDMKLNLCISLWEAGCLMSEYPLPILGSEH